jgi:hypothetical protein
MKTAIILLGAFLVVGFAPVVDLPIPIISTSLARTNRPLAHKHISPSVKVTGRVIWGTGNGVQKVLVAIDLKPERGEGWAGSYKHFVAETDVRGYYTGKVDTTGTYAVSLAIESDKGSSEIPAGIHQDVKVNSSGTYAAPDLSLGSLGCLRLTWRPRPFKSLPVLRIYTKDKASEESVINSGRLTIYLTPGHYLIGFKNSGMRPVEVSTGRIGDLDISQS